MRAHNQQVVLDLPTRTSQSLCTAACIINTRLFYRLCRVVCWSVLIIRRFAYVFTLHSWQE